MDLKSAQWMGMWISLCIYSVRAACDDKGWFGSQCQYKCHCQNKTCDTDGFCDNGVKCEIGWFGPRCQYQDLAVTANAQLKPEELKSVLSDGDDSTCNGRPTVNSVSVELRNASWITWIRLSYNDSVAEIPNLYQIVLELKERKADALTVKCEDLIKYVDQENNIIDIKCDSKIEVAYLNISGEIVGSLCSLYISGGRNIALKQRAAQSSTYNYVSYPNATRASNAVDGNRNGDFRANSCTHTDFGDQTPHWNLTFSRPQFIQRYILYNRNVLGHRLKSFQLNSFLMNTSVFNYTEPGEVKLQYEISTREIMKPVNKVQIHAIFVRAIEGAVLTLCEVEIYGEHLCDGDTFGLDCNTTCHCADRTEKCFVATGGCVSGCGSGYQGQGCEQKCQLNRWGKDCFMRCPVNCNNSRCHHVTGDCEVGCHSGFTGPDCSQAPCDKGKWGDTCQHSCSGHCLDHMSCHKDNGTCTGGCKEGYRGDTCEEDMCTDDMLKGIGIGAGASIGFVIFIASAVFIFKLYRVRKRKALGHYSVPSRAHTDYPYELPLSETSAPANVKREEGVYETINS